MANKEEPLLTDPPTHDVAKHVEDYSLFTGILKWGAIVAFVSAILVLFIIA